MTCYLIRIYRSVLVQGSKYLQHVMPRMLTVWLDFNPKNMPDSPKLGRKSKSTVPTPPVRDPNSVVFFKF